MDYSEVGHIAEVAMDYSEVQQIAKETMKYIETVIQSGINLCEIRQICENKMIELGADSFWYWDVGAFVFSGDETAISVSGTQYKTSDRVIMHDDIITIDLSPQCKNIWGDYARTIFIEDGSVVKDKHDIKNQDWKNGILMEDLLHNEMKKFADMNTTFEELYCYMNEFIKQKGYINLDFMGNLGHSIVTNKSDRIYIERGNSTKLSEVNMFTFEPHISVKNSLYGYKKENIYYFENGEIKEL